jgi:hypothetical protein
VRDNPVVVGVLGVAAVMWAYFTVAALVQGAYPLAVLDAVLFIGSVWTIMRILRRRRRQNRLDR